jgi:two-component system sensor histidine kinase BaeS
LQKSDFDLACLLEAAVERFRPLAEEKGITINTELYPSPISADYDRLTQVFINLLSNAVKYTDRGNISIRIAADGGEQHYRITVSDTGIGIPGEALPHIFERFYRSDKSRSRNSGGAGIGLAIASAIISAHGGGINAESAPPGSSRPGGSVFTVIL